MDNLITELYYGNICPVEQMGKLTPEAKALLKRMHENEDKLGANMNDQEKAIFNAIQDDRLDAACVIGEKRFRDAFILGARLMAEILMGGPQKLRRTPPQFLGGEYINKMNKQQVRTPSELLSFLKMIRQRCGSPPS